MEQWEKDAGACLTQKMAIIEQLAANTATEGRFIHKREMRGLGRVLEERENLLAALAVVNKKLAGGKYRLDSPPLVAMSQDIKDKEKKLMTGSRQALRDAVAERDLIAAELKQNRIERQVKNGYVHPWVSTAGGRLISEKG